MLKHSFDKQFNRTVNDLMADILMFASNECRADIMRITISTLEIKYFKQNAAHFVIVVRDLCLCRYVSSFLIACQVLRDKLITVPQSRLGKTKIKVRVK